MNSPSCLFYIFVLEELSRVKGKDIRFTAITDMHPWFLNKLYLDEWNEEPPSELDPSSTVYSVRQQICEDVKQSGVFDRFTFQTSLPADTREIMRAGMEHQTIKSDSFSSRIFKLNNFDLESINPYVEREFDVNKYCPSRQIYYQPIPIRKKEYTFVCVLQERKSNRLVLFYVSKAYGAFLGPRIHHFIFVDKHKDVLLAEESARVYSSPDFNPELHYLELRKYHEPAPTVKQDPVCLLSTPSVRIGQMFRLCAIVLTSSHFKANIKYPNRTRSFPCILTKISFRTEEGVKEANGHTYREFMLPCFADAPNENDQNMFYISRAYNPNQVFVYVREAGSRNFFIENLSLNVNIVHERYKFGRVEI